MSKREAGPANQMVWKPKTKLNSYELIQALDGTHPYHARVPEGALLYPVRRLNKGQVIYFNFNLAKEMGLIADSHPDLLNETLCETLLDTFCIQIINEYDELHGTKFSKATVKPNKYMATRYLQLQHANKKGKTSGDGRSIWNGVVQNRGVIWDVSSRGTGVTSLSPGSVEAGGPLRTGNEDMGYGCGLADVDELYGSALMSEIFHRQGITTERMLTIIDIGNGLGIGVRAAPNLVRPAHMFLFLKQSRYEALKKSTDYFIDRQLNNRVWTFNPNSKHAYDDMVRALTVDFAKFAAQLERSYIFAWLDWDGDNVLANAGIIDYGSVRQFGLRHDQYRYDDIQRFSTNLNEQKSKARLTLQVFIQMADYLKTKRKKPLSHFAKHAALKQFEAVFANSLREIFLQQVGLGPAECKHMLSLYPKLVEQLYSRYLKLETTKTKAKAKRVADGINRPAVFNMRALLRELPSFIKNWDRRQSKLPITSSECLLFMFTTFGKKRDSRLTPKLNQEITDFLQSYVRFIDLSAETFKGTKLLEQIQDRSRKQNQEGRITGNSIEFLVSEVIKAKKKGTPIDDIQAALNLFISHQSPLTTRNVKPTRPIDLSTPAGKLLRKLLEVAAEFEEDI